ncbi:hypothetical protein [Maribacter sp. 2210JD10-5]|uniref:hypothetical protein n=1 Tax=Maribacter sp. 2210JD10-5 TaxID=3386272 RepID=UPI0039BC31D7
MKKSKQLCLSVFGILLITVTSCKELKSDPKEPQEEIEVVAPAQIIPVAQAESFYNNYTKRRAKLIRKYEDSIDRGKRYTDLKQQKRQMSAETTRPKDSFIVARYVSYDYKTIKQYLNYVEQEAKKANVDIASLRFYFSNYPNKKKFHNGEPVYHPRQNSILISPTLKKGGEEFLFYTSVLENDGRAAMLLSDQFEDLDKGYGDNYKESQKVYASFAPTTKAFQDGKNSLTLNRGGGVPPNN